MATPVNYRFSTFSVNGTPYVEAFSTPNIPYGGSETDFKGAINTVLSRFTQDLARHQEALASGRTTNKAPLTEYQSKIDLLNSIIPKINTGQFTDSDLTSLKSFSPFGEFNIDQLRSFAGGGQVGSEYVIGPKTADNPTGFYKASSLDEMNRLASDPNMLNIGTADRPLYVPKGSPGSQLAGDKTPLTPEFQALADANKPTVSEIPGVGTLTTVPKPRTNATVAGSTSPVGGYSKVRTGNIGPDGKPIFDVYNSAGEKITLDQFKAAGLNIDHLPEENLQGLYARTGVQPSPELVGDYTGSTGGGASGIPSYGKSGTSGGSEIINAYKQLAAEISKISEELLKSKTKSPEELALQKTLLEKKASLEQFDVQTLQAIENYSGQGRGRTLGFIGNQQEKERRTRALERLGLATELNALTEELGLAQENRTVAGDIAQTQLQIANAKVDLALGIYKEQERMDDKEQDDARAYLLDVIDFAKGKTFEQLDQATQAQIIASVANSPITMDMVRTALQRGAKPEDVSTAIVSINGVKKIINSKTGETIKILGYDTDGESPIVTFSNVLSKTQIYALRSAGLADQTIQSITSGILGGLTLEEIRSDLRSKKIDPRVLDEFDRVVNIRNLLASSQVKKPTSSGRVL